MAPTPHNLSSILFQCCIFFKAGITLGNYPVCVLTCSQVFLKLGREPRGRALPCVPSRPRPHADLDWPLPRPGGLREHSRGMCVRAEDALLPENGGGLCSGPQSEARVLEPLPLLLVTALFLEHAGPARHQAGQAPGDSVSLKEVGSQCAQTEEAERCPRAGPLKVSPQQQESLRLGRLNREVAVCLCKVCVQRQCWPPWGTAERTRQS